MEANKKHLSEYIWEYVRTHKYCSKAVIAGLYIDTFGIQLRRGMGKTKQQKSLMRRVASMFTVMKGLGIVSHFSKQTIQVNREVFNTFTLPEVLKYKLSDFHKTPTNPKVSILSEIAQIK